MVSSTNKTDRHYITEILLKVVLNTITIQYPYSISYAEGKIKFPPRTLIEIPHHKHLFPKNTYKQMPVLSIFYTLGTLVSGVTGDIVASVVILEDISSDDAKHLGSLLSTIQDKAGGLFQAPDEQNVNVKIELQRNVPKWLRFTELITILNASLLEIADRWADGKGPLANEFSATEVKQLIRALFQNTERRANILTKIK